ncbi:MAG TPA: urease accessory UreF family protein [Solirubrobacteraceae bacterium]|nr:urease accessory UreF family protein [Solirubrobacteraceae bacterium]
MRSSSAALMLLSDGRLPTGGYAHSGGLEAAVAAAASVGDVPDFIAGRLEGVARAEAALAVAARRAAAAGELDELIALDAEALARCPSPPLRAAGRRLGSQLLRTATTLWPRDAVLAAYRERSGLTPRPVAFGVVAAAAGLDDLEAASVYLYEDAASVSAAAVRLLPVDGADAARWLLDAAPRIESHARAAAELRVPASELPAGFAPLIELGALDHDNREGKLFAT